MWSKTWAHGCSLAGIVGSNPTWCMDVCLLLVLCVCQEEVSATGWSRVQGSPTEFVCVCVSLHVQCKILLSDRNWQWKVSINFSNNSTARHTATMSSVASYFRTDQHTHKPISRRSVSMLSSHRILLLPNQFLIKILYFFFVNSDPSTCPAHRKLLHFTTISTPGDLYISGSSALFNTHPSYMPSPHKVPHNIIRVRETSENKAMLQEVFISYHWNLSSAR